MSTSEFLNASAFSFNFRNHAPNPSECLFASRAEPFLQSDRCEKVVYQSIHRFNVALRSVALLIISTT
ncbi:hypothetical protein WG66_012470 [Moniliophthora roreri]|nr:hypothetical protein WG66_012470 [Moniliophthora roreri]